MSRRILLLTLLHPLPDNPARGVFVADRARLLREMGHDVRVVNVLPRMLKMHEQRRSTMQGVSKAPRRFEFEGNEILVVKYTAFPEHPLPKLTASSIKRQAKKVEKWLQEWRPDLISVHTIWPAAELARSLAKRWDIPWMATVHGHDFSIGLDANQGNRIRDLCKSTDSLIVVGESLQGIIEGSVVIPCHIEVPNSNRNKMKRWHGRWRRGEIEILFPANSRRPEKNHLLALRTGRELETRGWRVKIGDLPNVPRDVVHDRMVVCDLALITSIRESGPLVAREAVACGLPVVSTDVGDLSEWLPERCIAEATPEALADAIETTLKNDNEDIAIPEKFESKAISSKLEKIFTQLLD